MMFCKESEFQESPMGKIPEDWEIQELSNFVEIETGKRAKGGGLSEGTVASIGGEHIDWQGNILWSDMKYIPDDFYNLLKQGMVQIGDILLVKDGATTGKVAIVKYLKYEKVAVNEHVFLIRSKTEKLSNEFLYYFLFSEFGQRQIKTRFHGLIGGIIRNDLENVLVPIPSVIEQRGVVGVLGVFDSAIELIDKVIAKTERLKKGLMQELLTKGIGHKEFKDTEMGKIPTTWEVVRLGDIAKLESGGTPSRQEPRYWKGNIPWLKSGELNDAEIYSTEEKITELGLKESAAKIFTKGTLLIALYGKGTVSKTAILGIDATTNQAIGALIPKGNSFEPKFLQHCLIFQRQKLLNQLVNPSSDVGRTNIYLGTLKLFRVPLPPIREQQTIADILSTIDKRIELERKEKARLERIKRGLMDLLLTGKVRIKVD